MSSNTGYKPIPWIYGGRKRECEYEGTNLNARLSRKRVQTGAISRAEMEYRRGYNLANNFDRFRL